MLYILVGALVLVVLVGVTISICILIDKLGTVIGSEGTELFWYLYVLACALFAFYLVGETFIEWLKLGKT